MIQTAKSWFAHLLLGLLLHLLGCQAKAQEIPLTIPSETFLRQAISTNSNSTNGVVIQLNFDNVLTLTKPLIISNNVTIYTFTTTNVVLTTNNSVVTKTTNVVLANSVISGGLSNRLFVITPAGTLTLKYVQLFSGRQGNPTVEHGGFTKADGGAIYVQGKLHAEDCLFQSHSAIGRTGANGGTGVSGQPGGDGEDARGGAIFNDNGLVELFRCKFNACSATGGGGGTGGSAGNSGNGGNGGAGGDGGGGFGGTIFNLSGNLTAVDCIFGTNNATGGAAAVGGVASGIGLNGGTGTAGGAQGGALFAQGGDIRILGSSFITNAAAGGAGAAGAAGLRSSAGKSGTPGGAAFGGAIATKTSLILSNAYFGTNACIGGPGGIGGAGGTAGFGGNGGNGGDGGGASGGAVYLYAGATGSTTGSIFAFNVLAPGIGGVGGPSGSATAHGGATGSTGAAAGPLITAEPGAGLRSSLSSRRVGTNTIDLTWLDTGATLQFTPSLSPANWTPLSGATLVNGTNYQSIQLTEPGRYFRVSP